MSPHKRKDVVVSDSDEEEEDGPTVTAHKKRLGRLRRAGSFAAAAHDVKDLCEDEDGTAARPTQAPLAPPLRAPPPAHSLQAPTPQRRTAIRERASSAKKDRERALARLARRRLHSGGAGFGPGTVGQRGLARKGVYWGISLPESAKLVMLTGCRGRCR